MSFLGVFFVFLGGFFGRVFLLPTLLPGHLEGGAALSRLSAAGRARIPALYAGSAAHGVVVAPARPFQVVGPGRGGFAEGGQ